MQTVTHERDGARQALAAAKLRGDKLKRGKTMRCVSSRSGAILLTPTKSTDAPRKRPKR